MEEFIHLLKDPSHWMFEGVNETITFLIQLVILDRLFHKHKA